MANLGYQSIVKSLLHLLACSISLIPTSMRVLISKTIGNRKKVNTSMAAQPNFSKKAVISDQLPIGGESLSAPTLYVEILTGAFVGNGVAKIMLSDKRMDLRTKELTAVHVATLAVPADQIANWAEFFTSIAQQIETER